MAVGEFVESAIGPVGDATCSIEPVAATNTEPELCHRHLVGLSHGNGIVPYRCAGRVPRTLCSSPSNRLSGAQASMRLVLQHVPDRQTTWPPADLLPPQLSPASL